ncbi:hypothetical protein I5F07_08350 [Proteus vulgaris]|uniref:Uncharacterized protein n=1 Tax=Providencia stuartii TaxID=588 RepID=A0A899NG14_PROST|nr:MULTISPECIES: hypothetical protein [Proteus]QSM62548.1 hypothetical protein EKPLLCFL_00313 [Providencia stuartii]UII02435.1 hypothetical protein [Providencia rettgeri]ELL8907459.1 hypothetical protein [Proteus mirabilis]MBG5984878.1 hypothetical protein [Proteus vulgaris]MCL8617596.1 hypothetical protein [Proteus mirabilis]
MIDPKTTKALNELAMGAQHHEHTLLAENSHLMEVFISDPLERGFTKFFWRPEFGSDRTRRGTLLGLRE